MLLPILHWPDPRLTTPCAPAVISPDLRQLAEDMLETMYAASGRGLAAPQVGHLLRLFVMDVEWKDAPAAPRIFVNPEIIAASSETSVMNEGCLSLPGFALPIERPAEITLRWQDLDGNSHSEHLTGIAAICAQHEYDHLDGRLTLSRTAPEALPAIAEALETLRAQAETQDNTAPEDAPKRTGGAV